MEVTPTRTPRQFMEIGGTFLVAGLVGLVLGAPTLAVAISAGLGAVLLVAGAIGLGRGRRT